MQRQTFTDPEGRFSFPLLRDQAYEVRARRSTWKEIRPGGEERIFRFPQPQIPAADAHVVGRVLDSVGNPAVQVQIVASESEHGTNVSYELDGDGTFRLGPMISGEWTLRFTSPRYPYLEQTVTLAAGMITDLGNIRLEEAVPVEVLVRKPAGLEGRVSARLWGPGFDKSLVMVWVRSSTDSRRSIALPLLGAGSYRLEIRGRNLPREVREFELVVGQQTNLEIDLQPGVVRSVQVDLPEGTESSRLTFTTFNGSGRELVSWRVRWNRPRNPAPRYFAFRPEAVRLVVISEDGKQADATLGVAEDIRLVLR